MLEDENRREERLKCIGICEVREKKKKKLGY